ncbi:MAG: carbamoyltransferase C-terminal domain-containing protein [Candidatus Peribacteraceae bacterium]|nr:carbamoyltransferase C-terminal domain-containing protein [Candidatus Peribacteraceae bacterium]
MQKDPYIIGFSDSVHDRSVCLFKGSTPLVAIEEERLTRVKHALDIFKESRKDPSLFMKLKLELSPAAQNEKNLLRSIQYCLDAHSLSLDQIDYFVGNSLHLFFPFRDRSLYVNHHLAHAASAFFASGFDDAAILIMDGYGDPVASGEYETVLIADGSGNDLRVVSTVSGQVSNYYDMENSLGVFYRIGTLLAGFGLFDEGKAMGLSAYGKPKYYERIAAHICYGDAVVKVDNKSIWEELSLAIVPRDAFEVRADVAASFQKHLEEIVAHYADIAKKKTGKTRLCIAGGTGLNCVSNAKLLLSGQFDDVFVFPATGDNGISLGSAYYLAHTVLRLPRTPQLPAAYLGRDYSDEECERALQMCKGQVEYRKMTTEERCAEAVRLLLDHDILMWFQGGSEIGPRALGHRSILANPDNKKTKDYINEKVKFREMFRPLAPIVLEDQASKYFRIPKASPYMLFSPPIQKITKEVAPAVVHVDNTARLQTLNKTQNPILYEVISRFGSSSGCPIVLNTSFNGKDEPIVETPQEAIRTFLGSPVSHLFLESFYVKKLQINDQSKMMPELERT